MGNRIVVASRNKKKVGEIKNIFGSIGYSVLSLDDLGIDIRVEEDGDTFEANSYKKAFEVMKATGEIALADDSGLEVEALGGLPGVHSARFAGEGASDQENNIKLLSLMQDIPGGDRKARFVCVITVVFPDGGHISARGECEGQILFEPRGCGGFGYDPLFYIPDYGKTFAELEPEVKNAISHRAKALSKIKEMLEQIKEGGKV